jgi:hypothetical protein
MDQTNLDLLSLPAGTVLQVITKSASWIVVTTDSMQSFFDIRVNACLVNGVVAYRLEGFVLTADVAPQSWFFSRYIAENQVCHLGDSLTLPWTTDPVLSVFRTQGDKSQRLV